MIRHNCPTLGEEEKLAASRVIESRWLAQGIETSSLEDEFCEYLGLPAGHAVALSSGTAALFVALKVLDAGNKSVAYPAYACSALRNATAMAGGKEVLLDILAGTPNLDLDEAAKNRPDILIAPHLFGIPSKIPHLPGIRVIEDCAQSLGAKVEDIPVGLQGDIGIHSFYVSKLMTSGGQGGMLVSKDRSVADAARDYREFDCRRDRVPRFNFQMTDLQAAIGRVQLGKLPSFLQRREEIFSRYRQAGLDLLDSGFSPVRYRAVLKTEHPSSVIEALAKRNIRAIVPIEDWEILGEGFPNALSLSRTSVSLPIYPSLSLDALDSVIEGVLPA